MITIRDTHDGKFYLTRNRAYDREFFASKSEVEYALTSHRDLYIVRLPGVKGKVPATYVSAFRNGMTVRLGCHTFKGRQALRLLRWAEIE